LGLCECWRRRFATLLQRLAALAIRDFGIELERYFNLRAG
jgi:hypothetical protein